MPDFQICMSGFIKSIVTVFDRFSGTSLRSEQVTSPEQLVYDKANRVIQAFSHVSGANAVLECTAATYVRCVEPEKSKL